MNNAANLQKANELGNGSIIFAAIAGFTAYAQIVFSMFAAATYRNKMVKCDFSFCQIAPANITNAFIALDYFVSVNRFIIYLSNFGASLARKFSAFFGKCLAISFFGFSFAAFPNGRQFTGKTFFEKNRATFPRTKTTPIKLFFSNQIFSFADFTSLRKLRNFTVATTFT